MGVPDGATLPAATATWPRTVLWIAAAPRGRARAVLPLARHVRLQSCCAHGNVLRSGDRFDAGAGEAPEGAPESRFAKVFRTDWEGGRAFYHPYDRVAANSHADWSSAQPHLVWNANHTIVDYLAEFHALLNSGDYLGV